MPKRAKSPARRKSTTPRRRRSTRQARPTTPSVPSGQESDSGDENGDAAGRLKAEAHDDAGAAGANSNSASSATALTGDPPVHASKKPRALVGITRSGKRFAVPHVDDTFHMLGRVWEVPTVLAWMAFAVTAGVAAMSSPRWPAIHRAWGVLGLGHAYVSPVAIIYVAIFWRLMYNVVLGLLLRAQSQRQIVTRWIDGVTAAYSSAYKQGRTVPLVPRIVNAMLSTTLNCTHPLLEMPAELNAWVFTRYFVNIVLANDVVAFVGVVLIHGDGNLDFQCNTGLSATLGENRGWCDVSTGVAWMVGIALVIASLWSKKLSHGVVGAFAWFWGDMFFLAKQDLTFDGIFEIVPHPMYTVGYGWMYGTAIVSGSWVVLAVALGSHLSQLMFLALVETPHIEGLYGSEFSRETKEWKATHTNDNIFVIKSFDMYRASDWSLMLVLLLLTGFAFAGVNEGHPIASPSDIVLFTVAARLLGTFVIGYILARQDRTQFWTAHFSSTGLDARLAFDEWKRLYNLISSIMSLSFVLCALRLRSTTFDLASLLTPMGLTSSFGAVITIGVSVWAMMESHAALGDYGWFFGDFFLPNNQGGQFIQKGIYRFLSNPETVLGNLWMYGLSVLVGSREAFFVALLCHSIHTVLVLVIEEPHKHRMYKRQLRVVPEPQAN